MDGTARRILQLLPSWEHVGPLRRIATLAEHLDSSQFEFRLAALSSRGPDPYSITGLQMPTTTVATGPRLGIALAPRLRRLLVEWRPDVVHAWSRDCTRLARLALVGMKRIRLRFAEATDYSVAVEADKLLRTAEHGRSRTEVLAALGLPADIKILGTVARLTRGERVGELLWALDQIRCVRSDVYLIVIGDGEARAHFERYARLYQVDDHVRLLGWRADAVQLMRHFDVYCSASDRESPSLAMLEAMALGLPVVASDTPANRQLVVPGQTGFLVDIAQRSEIARWCLCALEDTDLAARMSQAARQRAATAFSVAPLIERTRQAYQGQDR
jgi:glycosyltransferase involved in cell wall biosynthesis